MMTAIRDFLQPKVLFAGRWLSVFSGMLRVQLLFNCLVIFLFHGIEIYLRQKFFGQDFNSLLPAYFSPTLDLNRSFFDFAYAILLISGNYAFWYINRSARRMALHRFIRDLPVAVVAFTFFLIAVRTRIPALSTLSLIGFFVGSALFLDRLKNGSIRTIPKSFLAFSYAGMIATFLISWFPVTIPSDYYEIEERYLVQRGVNDGAFVPRSEILPIQDELNKKIANYMDSNQNELWLILNPFDINKGSNFFIDQQTQSFLKQSRIYDEKTLNEDLSADSINVFCRTVHGADLDFCQSLIARSKMTIRTNKEDLIRFGTDSLAYHGLLSSLESWAASDPGFKNVECVVRKNFDPFCRATFQKITNSRLGEINKSIWNIGIWSSAAGRLLFHHSYLFVPAKAYALVGHDAQTPTLYGFGNTLIFAGAMKIFGSTLNVYYSSYAAIYILGSLLISLMLYILIGTRIAFLGAGILSSGFLLSIGYETVFLAPGFNPIRYIGLSLQVISLILFARVKVSHYFLSLAFLISAFFNFEYALFGAIGQVLILITLNRHPLSSLFVPLMTFCSAIFLVFAVKLSYNDPSSLMNVSFGIFGIGLPSIGLKHYLVLAFCTVGACGVYIWSAVGLDRGERSIRIAIMPILALMPLKFVFNASPVHFLFSMAFVAPFALDCGFLLARKIASIREKDSILKAEVGALFVMVALASSAYFLYTADQFRKVYINEVRVETFAALSDQVRTATNPSPIVSRVNDINKTVPDNSRVLMLSPFDHLLAFYINTHSFCGNFEILTNLVTLNDLKKLGGCFRPNQSVYLIYDKANEVPCERLLFSQFFSVEGCRGRLLLKNVLRVFYESVLPFAVEKKEIGDLVIARFDGPLPESVDFSDARSSFGSVPQR